MANKSKKEITETQATDKEKLYKVKFKVLKNTVLASKFGKHRIDKDGFGEGFTDKELELFKKFKIKFEIVE